MANYAIVKDGVVINTCAWDGVTTWQPTEGAQAIKILEGAVAGVGYSYINGQFIAPSAIEIVEQYEEDLIASLTSEQKQALITMLLNK